jgi:hypothetical protein
VSSPTGLSSTTYSSPHAYENSLWLRLFISFMRFVTWFEERFASIVTPVKSGQVIKGAG